MFKFNPFTKKLDIVGSGSGPSTGLQTLSAEGGAATPPDGAGNYNFSGSTAGGSSANGAFQFITPGGPGAATNGQMDGKVLIDNVTVTINGSNQLVAAQGFHWTVTASTAFTPVHNTGYILTGIGLATITLPPAPALDFEFAVIDRSGNLFVIAQNPGDSIQMAGNLTTTGAGGSIASTAIGDKIDLVCWAQGPGSSWIVIDSLGTLNIV